MKKVIYSIIVFLVVFTSCKKDESNPVNTDTIPPIPTLSTPKDTTSNIAVPVVLTWNESNGATSYTLQVSASSSFSSFVFNKSDITTTTQQIPDTNYLKIYYWRVNAGNSFGTSDWSKVWSFTTTGEAAFVPALYQPYDGAVGQKIAPNLIWNPVGNNSRYTLQISSNSSFTNLVFDSDSLIENSINITSLSGSTKYYWHVKADNNFGSKGWSDTWSFTTGIAPVPPVLLSPIDGATNQLLSLSLSWNASSGAMSYNLQVATDSTFSSSSLIANQNVGNTNAKQISGLSKSKIYYWKVATVNSYGTSGWSSVWSFSTGSPPEAPTQLAPTNGATDQLLSPIFSWNSSIGATTYTLQISTSISFTSYTYNQSNLTNTTQQLSGLSPLTNYYWRVSATNNYGTSVYSTIWGFSTTGVAPLVPLLAFPVNGATNQSITPTLSWYTSNMATSYILQVATNDAFSSLIFNSNVGNVTSKQIDGLDYLKTYYWRVSATNNYGTSYSITRNFMTTGVVPQPPTLNTPINAATDIALPLTFTWNTSTGALSYILQVATDNNFTNMVYNNDVGNITSKQISGLNGSTKYYWRLTAVNSFGQSNPSDIWNFVTISNGSCPGTPTVTYEGKTYNTVLIGSQCWLKENLDIGIMIQGPANMSNNGTIEKYCYDNNTVNCNTFGGLYKWAEAMNYGTTPGKRGICPDGWHIPTNAEFITLTTVVNNNSNSLKAIGQGSGTGAGTNTSGFAALFAGYRDDLGSFVNLGIATYIWSSTDFSATHAYRLGFYSNSNNIQLVYDYDEYGLSVRCIKD